MRMNVVCNLIQDDHVKMAGYLHLLVVIRIFVPMMSGTGIILILPVTLLGMPFVLKCVTEIKVNICFRYRIKILHIIEASKTNKTIIKI